MGTITNLLHTRASVRRYQPRPIPREVLDDILEAGRLSPSGGNEQPWCFVVLTCPERIALVAEIAHHQTWLASAPLLIVLCTVCVSDERGGRDIQMQRYPHFASDIAAMDPDLYWALNQEEHQTKIAGTHMALAALEHGVGSCWVSLFDVCGLAALLDLPHGILPSEMLALGYPAQAQRSVPKKSLEELVIIDPPPDPPAER